MTHVSKARGDTASPWGCPACHAVGPRGENSEFLRSGMSSSTPLGSELFCLCDFCGLDAPLIGDDSWAVVCYGKRHPTASGASWSGEAKGHSEYLQSEKLYFLYLKAKMLTWIAVIQYVLFVKTTNSSLEKHKEESKNHNKSDL